MSSVDETIRKATATRAALTWFDASGAPHAFDLEGRTRATIGRGSRCDLVIRDNRISRRHATIELVHGQHLLRDAGSANGTYLNGLRLTPGSAFGLRAGDTIEVGGERLTFEGPSTGLTTPGDALEGARYALEDLLADGEKELAPDERTNLDIAAHRAVMGVPLDEGLKRVLSAVAERLRVQHAGAFIEDAFGKVHARAGWPTPASTAALHALAARAAARREGRLLFGPMSLEEVGSGEDTRDECETSYAAAPFATPRIRGVLAVQRTSGERLTVRSLAFLAVMGRSLARCLG